MNMKNLKRKAALALTLCLIMSIFLCIPANAAESANAAAAVRNVGVRGDLNHFRGSPG